VVRRSRVLFLLFAAAAMIAASLALATPASADTSGPVQNVGNGLCFQPAGNSTASGTDIVQEPCDFTIGTRNLSQEWDYVCTNSSCGTVHVVNRASQLCLRARGPNGPANGLEIMLWACNSITDLNWDFGPNPGSLSPNFELRSRISGSTSFCLDVPGASGAIGVALQLFQCNGTVAQLWRAPDPIIE
jgi:hypothetical protein